MQKDESGHDSRQKACIADQIVPSQEVSAQAEEDDLQAEAEEVRP